MVNSSPNWFDFIAVVFIILSFYFTLTFFQYLKIDDERVIKQSKYAAVICLAIALIIILGFVN